MKRNHGVVLAALLAAFAFAAIAASAAQAHEYMVEGKPIASGAEMSFQTSVRGKVVLKAKPLGVNMTLTCNEVETKGALLAAGKASNELKLSSCTITQIANCTVPQPLVIGTTSQLLSEPALEEFAPATGSKLSEFTLEGASCSIKGTYELEGDQVCEVANAGVEATMHELFCSTWGSVAGKNRLTFGGRAATLESSEIPIELGSKESYSVK